MNRKIFLAASFAIIMQLTSGFASNPAEDLQDGAAQSAVISSPSSSPVAPLEEDIAQKEGFVVLSSSDDETEEASKKAKLKSLAVRAKSMTFEEFKDLDQNGSKYAGSYVKRKVEKLPGGKVITSVTSFIASQIDPNAESLTEVALNAARKPFQIPEEQYPETKAGVVGTKLQKVVALAPYGDKAVAVARKIAKAGGKDTLSELIVARLSGTSSAPTLALEDQKPADEQKEEKKNDE